MARSQRHIIQRLEVNLETNHREGAQIKGDQFSQLLKNDFLPRLEKNFDTLVSHNIHIRLDKLELTVHWDGEEKNKAILVQQLIEQVQTEVQQRLSAINTKSFIDFSKSSKEQSFLECWYYFLRTGSLPWWCRKMSQKEWIFNLHGAIEKQPEIFQIGLRKVLSSNPEASKRLLWQHSDQTLLLIFKKLFTNVNISQLVNLALSSKEDFHTIQKKLKAEQERLDQKAFEILLAFWKNLEEISERSPLQVRRKSLKEKFYKNLLEFWVKGEKLSNNTELFSQIVKRWTSEMERIRLLKIWLQDLLKRLPSNSNFSSEIEALIRQLDQKKKTFPFEVPKEWDIKLSRLISDLNKTEIHVSDKIMEYLEKSNLKTPPKPDLSPINSPSELPLTEGVYVENAGLVLLHPFLFSFFQTLDLCERKYFKSEKKQIQSIYLLHYLTTGTTRPLEYELLLNKLLCGWPLDKPINQEIRISKKMKDEAEKMLSACLKHWKVLQKSSPDALRGNFLLREGKLILKDKGWQLIVERKTSDVLLDSLPWGIRTIKLPWMDEILFVEW